MYLFDSFLDNLGKCLIDLTDNTLIAIMIDEGVQVPQQTSDAVLSALASGARFGRVTLGGGAVSGGAFSVLSSPGGAHATSLLFTGVSGGTIDGVLFAVDSGAEDSSYLIGYDDGRFTVKVAANAASGATSLWVEPLDEGLASGAVLVLSGGVSGTLTAAAAQGARQVSVAALSAAVTAGQTAPARAASCGYPFVLDGSPVAVSLPDPLFTY